MGIFGFSKVSISFAGKVPEAFEDEKKLLVSLNEFKEGHYDICDYNVGEEYAEFEMSSGRIQNLEWQVDNVFKYLQEHKIQVEEFSASGYMETDSASHYYTADDGPIEHY